MSYLNFFKAGPKPYRPTRMTCFTFARVIKSNQYNNAKLYHPNQDWTGNYIELYESKLWKLFQELPFQREKSLKDIAFVNKK